MEQRTKKPAEYPARLDIDYPEKLDRFTTFFRLVWVVPILFILTLLTGAGGGTMVTEAGEEIAASGGGIAGGLFVATMLMLVFRQKYPRWWFEFARETARFGTRVGAYLALLTDQYPSTDQEQTVHLELDYPNSPRDLGRSSSGYWRSPIISFLRCWQLGPSVPA